MVTVVQRIELVSYGWHSNKKKKIWPCEDVMTISPDLSWMKKGSSSRNYHPGLLVEHCLGFPTSPFLQLYQQLHSFSLCAASLFLDRNFIFLFHIGPRESAGLVTTKQRCWAPLGEAAPCSALCCQQTLASCGCSSSMTSPYLSWWSRWKHIILGVYTAFSYNCAVSWPPEQFSQGNLCQGSLGTTTTSNPYSASSAGQLKLCWANPMPTNMHHRKKKSPSQYRQLLGSEFSFFFFWQPSCSLTVISITPAFPPLAVVF